MLVKYDILLDIVNWPGYPDLGNWDIPIHGRHQQDHKA